MGTFSNMVLHNSTVMENGIPYSAKCPYCYTDVQHHGCLILTYLLTRSCIRSIVPTLLRASAAIGGAV